MKFISLFFLLIPVLFFAQDIKNDSLSKNEFIEEYYRQLNIKIEVSKETENYKLYVFDDFANFSPNLSFRYALGFSYKFLSFRLGLRPGRSDESVQDKGESDIFRASAKLLFEKWSHHFQYNYIKGYYIKNTQDYISVFDDINYHLQFPNMKTSTFSGTSAYKFNKNYSVRAIESQTEIQIKSAGSFMPSVDYWFYKISDLKEYINPNGETIERENYKDFQGINTILNIGYYYTFVYHKKWYANVFATPGAGIDFYKIKATTPDGQSTNNNTNFVYSIQSGAAIGYSTRKYYFGADFRNRFSNENYGDDQLKLRTSTNVFHIFIGYRFKAPKTVAVPIDLIEKKVPILQEKTTKNI